MERKVVAVCTVVGFLGLLSAALGFAAEGTRLKATDVQATKSGECIYPKSPALALGLLATVALITAQAIINTAAGCICSKRNSMPSDSNWTVALISFIFSWIAVAYCETMVRDLWISYCFRVLLSSHRADKEANRRRQIISGLIGSRARNAHAICLDAHTFFMRSHQRYMRAHNGQ